MYHTFAWIPNPRDSFTNGMFNNEITERNVKNYATQEMIRRGLRVSTDEPDLLLEYNMQTERKLRTVQTPIYDYAYNYNWGAFPYYDPYRRYMYGYGPPPYIAGYQTDQIPYTEGTLTLSVIDRRTNTLIWRGWNIEKLTDPETFSRSLKNDVSYIFRKFPVAPLKGNGS
jgi:hypothetical protein